MWGKLFVIPFAVEVRRRSRTAVFVDPISTAGRHCDVANAIARGLGDAANQPGTGQPLGPPRPAATVPSRGPLPKPDRRFVPGRGLIRRAGRNGDQQADGHRWPP